MAEYRYLFANNAGPQPVPIVSFTTCLSTKFTYQGLEGAMVAGGVREGAMGAAGVLHKQGCAQKHGSVAYVLHKYVHIQIVTLFKLCFDQNQKAASLVG